MTKLGLFGGTFAPVHAGPLDLARALFEHLELDAPDGSTGGAGLGEPVVGLGDGGGTFGAPVGLPDHRAADWRNPSCG